MPKRNHRKIRHIRQTKFVEQGGRCHYCRAPMWETSPERFAQAHKLNSAQTRRHQSTAEHLVPHGEGGCDSQQNIVAACLYCNSQRHKSLTPLAPPAYQRKVIKRLKVGRWHGFAP